MSIFAHYFAVQLLRQAGWPRKLGMFKGEGYDASIADSAFAQSIDWGAGLGAGRGRLALQMLAAMLHEKDWEGANAPDVKVFVEGAREMGWETAASPQEAVSPPQIAERMATLSVDQFRDEKLMLALEQLLFHALMWGLTYPDRFEAWYSSNVADRESMLPLMEKAGLEVGELPSLAQFFEDSAQIVRDYELDIEALPSIPPRLLADAEALGWSV